MDGKTPISTVKVRAKVSYFFISKEKFVLTHSLKFGNICIFFSKKMEKKNTAVFFIFPGKVYVPLSQVFWRSLFKKKRGKSVKKNSQEKGMFHTLKFFGGAY